MILDEDFTVGSSVSVDDNFIIGKPIQLGITNIILPTGSQNYQIYNQTTPLATWTINHNFNRIPSITVIGSDGFVIITDIEYPNNALVVITFAQPTTGKALLV